MRKRLVLGLAVLWAGISFLSEMRQAATGWDARAEWSTWPDSWRFGTPQVARLEGCLLPARRLLPPGSIVAFAHPEEPQGLTIFHQRWAAYLLPAQEVLLREDAAAATAAQYVIAYDADVPAAGLVKLRQLPACVLYRVSRP
ncbi:MAG TPA: hypothetical protein VF173_04585 [Thermoanaerobaculia bacterium]|nr:hypothetical protein [Thermoanaerobaculia bacterium]